MSKTTLFTLCNIYIIVTLYFFSFSLSLFLFFLSHFFSFSFSLFHFFIFSLFLFFIVWRSLGLKVFRSRSLCLFYFFPGQHRVNVTPFWHLIHSFNLNTFVIHIKVNYYYGLNFFNSLWHAYTDMQERLLVIFFI